MVDGEEVEEADVTMVLAGGEAYTQQDRFTGRGSTGMFSEEGMEGRERDRVRGLCARIVSGTGATMGGRGAGPQLPFIPSRLPSESVGSQLMHWVPSGDNKISLLFKAKVVALNFPDRVTHWMVWLVKYFCQLVNEQKQDSMHGL